MSKKTNREKLADRKRKPVKRAKNHKRKRPNPLKAERPVPDPGLFGDPVFMGHVCAALFRALELKQIIRSLPPPGEIITPEQIPNSGELTSTGNSESPDSQTDPEEKQ